MLVIVVLTFFEYGFSTSAESFFDDESAQNHKYNYSVNELLFYLTNDMFLRERNEIPIGQLWPQSNPLICQDKRRKLS